MLKRLTLCANVFFVLFVQSVYGIDQQQIKQLTEVMVTGCSLGQKIDIAVEADGKLSFIIEKGGKGTFKASKSEIPSVINFLIKEEAKERQADETKKCMQRYMDKIFDAVLGNDSKSEKPRSKGKSITRIYAVDQTYDTHDPLNKNTESYSKQFSSERGYKITHYEWIEESGNHVSDFKIELIDNGQGVRVIYKLTCGPAYDQWRGWLKGKLKTTQEPL